VFTSVLFSRSKDLSVILTSFIIFINDLVDSYENNLKLYLFADDAKMYCHIKDALDVDNLQRGINNFVKWTERWQVTLNINKCKVISPTIHR